MFIINGSIRCSDIDYGTNSFSIQHNFGLAKASSKSFTFELNGKIEQFRPAYVTFKNNEIKVSLGTYRFNTNGTIRYSFTAYNAEVQKNVGTSPYLYFNLVFVQSATLFAKMNIKGIIPGDVVVMSDIPFSTIQPNRTPKFFWRTPSRNAEESNSGSQDVIYKDIVGYYYAFNKEPSYFITKIDSYIQESSNSSSNSVYVTFPTSGAYYFHIRAVNSAGNISRNTTHVEVIYNSPPTKPTSLMVNGKVYYSGSSNINVFSWVESSNSDNDDLRYEIEIYKNNELYYSDYIYPLFFVESSLFGKMRIMDYLYDDSNSYSHSNSFSQSSDSSSFCGYSFEDDVIKTRQIGRVYHIYNRDTSKNRHGSYYYILRAYDWAEQSEWSGECYYDIINSFVYFDSKMWIGTQDTDNNLTGKFFIYGDKSFFGNLYILPCLYGRTNICDAARSGFYGTLVFKSYFDLFGSMEIETNFSDFFGRLHISCVPGYSELCGRLRTVIEHEETMFGKMLFRNYSSSCLYGEMFVIGNGSGGLNGSVFIIRERISGKMSIIRNYSNDSVSTDKGRFFAKMNISNYPPEPIITSDVGHDWQDSNIINFSWTIPRSKVNVVAYEYLVSTAPVTDFSSASFYRTVRQDVSINLKNYYDDGVYYFYVRSISDNGSVSYASSYVVRYNNIPSTPSLPMFVNDNECVDNTPIISRSEYNVFKWPKSSHLDRDVVRYQLQISSTSSFSDIIVNINDISDITESEFVSKSIKHDYSDSYDVFYWRVRAYDVYQYTEYGYVGKFRCNTRPGTPTNLRVENEV